MVRKEKTPLIGNSELRFFRNSGQRQGKAVREAGFFGIGGSRGAGDARYYLDIATWGRQPFVTYTCSDL
jgi:hypothetical protein